MSSRSREFRLSRVLDWTCPTCNIRMALKDQQGHLNGSRHARAATQKGSVIVTPGTPIRTKNFDEFVAEQRQIYIAKKGQIIAAAIEEQLAREADECVSVVPSVPATNIPRFAPGARFPSRPPTGSELPAVGKKDRLEKTSREAGPSRKEGLKKDPKEVRPPEAVKKDGTKKAPKETQSPELLIAAGRRGRNPRASKMIKPFAEIQGDEVEIIMGKIKSSLATRKEIEGKVPREVESSTAVKTDRVKRTPQETKLPIVVQRDKGKVTQKETESPLVAKKERAKKASKETELLESPATKKLAEIKKAMKEIELLVRRGEAKRTLKATESPTMVKKNRPKRTPKGESQPPTQPSPSATEASLSVYGALETTQEPTVVESRSRCSTCNFEMAAKEYRAHLTSWHHLAIAATANRIQIVAQLAREAESEPASFASPASSEFPAQIEQNGSFEVLNFDELHYVDDVSVTSQEALPPAADNIWTLLFRQSHQEGIKHLENLKRGNKHQSHDRHHVTRKPRFHPDGSRWIRICQIPEVYGTLTELPAQSWLDAFIALPRGFDTLVTAEEYELACDAFNSSGLMYNTDTQWGIPLDKEHMASAQWY